MPDPDDERTRNDSLTLAYLGKCVAELEAELAAARAEVKRVQGQMIELARISAGLPGFLDITNSSLGQLLIAENTRLREACRSARDYHYNPFEPDNQSELYRQLTAALGEKAGGE